MSRVGNDSLFFFVKARYFRSERCKERIPRFVMNALQFVLCVTRLRRRGSSRTSW